LPISVYLPTMAAPPLDGFYVWWHEDTPDRIRLASSNPDIVGDDGEKPGLQIAFSSNPRSADYHPANFNRLARWLELSGEPHPDPVPVADRRLDRRPQ
jgi:hypothetical protein